MVNGLKSIGTLRKWRIPFKPFFFAQKRPTTKRSTARASSLSWRKVSANRLRSAPRRVNFQTQWRKAGRRVAFGDKCRVAIVMRRGTLNATTKRQFFKGSRAGGAIRATPPSWVRPPCAPADDRIPKLGRSKNDSPCCALLGLRARRRRSPLRLPPLRSLTLDAPPASSLPPRESYFVSGRPAVLPAVFRPPKAARGQALEKTGAGAAGLK